MNKNSETSVLRSLHLAVTILPKSNLLYADNVLVDRTSIYERLMYDDGWLSVCAIVHVLLYCVLSITLYLAVTPFNDQQVFAY